VISFKGDFGIHDFVKTSPITDFFLPVGVGFVDLDFVEHGFVAQD
jgi:hypothetical protein